MRDRLSELVSVSNLIKIFMVLNYVFSPGDLTSREIQWLTLKMIRKDHICKIFLVM